jgi:hypothetical protein
MVLVIVVLVLVILVVLVVFSADVLSAVSTTAAIIAQ